MPTRQSVQGNTGFSLIERRIRGYGGGLLLMLCVGTPAAAQFSVQPVIVELPASDTIVAAVIEVVNQGNTDLLFRFYGADFDQDASGDHAFLDSGNHRRSCAERLSVTPDGATIGALQRQPVVARLAPGADSTCWSLLFIEGSNPQASGIHVNQRIGVKVYGLAKKPAREAEVTAVHVAHRADTLAITIDVRNRGNIPLRPFGRVELRNMSGHVLQSVDVDAFSVLPGYLRRAVVTVVAKLPAGAYLAVPILDFGNDYLIGGQASFEVP